MDRSQSTFLATTLCLDPCDDKPMKQFGFILCFSDDDNDVSRLILKQLEKNFQTENLKQKLPYQVAEAKPIDKLVILHP